MKQGNGDPSQLLGRLAAGIDDIIEAEMSSALETVSDGGASPRGALADTDMPLLIGRSFVAGMTGRLRVRGFQSETAVYFESGLPVMASSDASSDRMSAMLAREGAITAEQREEAERMVDVTGRKMGAVLVDMGLLRTDELLPAVRRHYESIILSAFSWSRGHWQIDPGVTAGPDRTRLLRHPATLVREGLSVGYSIERLTARLGSGKNVFSLDRSGSASDLLVHVLTDPSESRVPLLFDGVRSLEEVARASGLRDSAVWQIALTLSCFGALLPADASSNRDVGRLTVRDIRLDRERVLARHALAVEGDYFQVLGVDREANSGDVRRAHARLVRDLLPETLGPDLSHELKAQIVLIREVLDEGLRVLTTPAVRSAYEFNLAHGPDAADTQDPSTEG
jgi:hypothetical protein